MQTPTHTQPAFPIIKRCIPLLLWFLASGYGNDRLFKSLHLSVAGGVLQPISNLSKVVEAAHSFGIIMGGSYYKKTEAELHIYYSNLHVPTIHRRLHYLRGYAGLNHEFSALWIPAIGAGFSNHFIRTQTIPKPLRKAYLFDDNESEFGAYVLIRWRIPLGPVHIFAQCNYDAVFSQPKFTRFLGLHAGIKIKAW